MSGLFLALTAAGDADTSPKMFEVSHAARVEGAIAADNDARMKGALVQALVLYLWRCADHGGLRTSTAGAYLPADPTASARPPPATASAQEPLP